jgi:N-acetylmuramoyl-L-alanine amidase/Bacterial SH3 domain
MRSGIIGTLSAAFTILIVWLVLGLACQSPAASAPEPSVEPQEDISRPVIPLEGPIVVAVQPGHWKIDELPAESRRRPRSIGAVHGTTREVDINLAVVDALVPMLEEENWRVIVVPATVPPGLRADVFLSIHADWGSDPDRRGWKLAPPWRPSIASREISEALKSSFRAEERLKEDEGGVTVGMRGYFGFSSHRYLHASSPYTPAVLIELGFVTNAGDRELMLSQPEYYAGIIHRGLEQHFYTRGRSGTASLVPLEFESMTAGEEGAVVRRNPDHSSSAIHRLDAGDFIRPVDTAGGWYEILLRNPFRTGWVWKDELVMRSAPVFFAESRQSDTPRID